jgi:hypothetical protein
MIIIIIIIMESKAKLKGPWSQRRLLLLLMNKWIELNWIELVFYFTHPS